MADDLENLILRTVERFMAARYTERHGLVTSYDPKNHLAKVAFQPEGQESGWLPIETGHVGDQHGIFIGLTPGDGKGTGDQVIVRYQEGDFESGKIVKRIHSDEDRPLEVKSGEMLFQHKSGAKIFMDKDGKTTITDKTGNGSIVMDGSGNITIKAKKIILDGDVHLGADGGKPLAIQGTIDTHGDACVSNLATKVFAT